MGAAVKVEAQIKFGGSGIEILKPGTQCGETLFAFWPLFGAGFYSLCHVDQGFSKDVCVDLFLVCVLGVNRPSRAPCDFCNFT
ncbi:hypothetical protein D3C84_1001750 [compost metagenome]